MQIDKTLIHVAYMLASVLFIFGLKRLSSIKTSRQGNMLASLAMLIAIIATLVDLGNVSYTYILAGVVIGSAIGAFAALKVEMTAMPEMVAIFNGMGGGASALVALSYVFGTDIAGRAGTTLTMSGASSPDVAVTIILSLLIGGVTFSGSVIAWAKLQGVMTGNPVLFKGQNVLNGLILLAVVVAGAMLAFGVTGRLEIELWTLVMIAIALVLGVLSVIPIGGADMPVVISLLNSYSGLAAAMTGFVLQNNLLIISGSLVGAAGLILTQIMCKAMNRSLANVLFSGFGGEQATGGGREEGYTDVKSASAEEAAMILDSSSSVIIVPGYGLAVAQAQHILREMADLLEKRGCNVRYAIHPVAGRMPGHMNVLLAEANVPYDKLFEMEAINSDFKNTDVALIVGANDVVNPAAIKDEKSPIYGMPILNVHEAQTVFVIKRSLSPGFAGIRNELFELPNSLMLFDDAKKMLTNIVEELKAL
jgi:NAD(P) transhydrogenase subunit beta